ncbi:MAG TPA: methyltransferase domain-containing protein [Motilibacterales bacterium]|nr:methyltransferase domain-containing protein [Motilibacterales bacterium]
MRGDRGRLLVFGSYDATLHPRVAVLRDGLAARGWHVQELNEPLGAATADKVAAAGSASAAMRLAGRQVRSWARLVRRSGGGPAPDVVLVGYMGHADVHLARLRYRRSVIALDHLVGLADTVRDRRLGGGMKLRLLDLVDRAALRAADVVVVDTPLQAQALPAGARSRAVVVPVGAGREWFAAADRAAADWGADWAAAHRRGARGQVTAVAGASSPTPGAGATSAPLPAEPALLAGKSAPLPAEPALLSGERALRVVFFGLFTPLQGTPTIARAIDVLRDQPIEFTMIGHGQDLAEALALTRGSPRVRWLDWVDAQHLPALVAGHHVSLGIFGTGPKAQRVVPTKVYQGLAAGCAVVTAGTPATGTLKDAVVSVPPGDPEALADALRHLALDKESLTVARDRARAAAGQFSPEPATAGLDARLQATPKRGALPPLTFNAHLRWDVISRELADVEVIDVLEIGPGEGAVACRLAPGRNYTGVELSDRTRAITQERLVQLGAAGRLVASLDDLPPDERFDLVCAFEVIEHIDADREALASWVARLRPGGTLLISTPAGPDRMGAADEIAGHFRRYSAEGLAALAEECGLVDVRVTHVGHPVGYLLERVRNTVAARRLARAERAAGSHDAVAAATEQSSSFLQPPSWSGGVTQLASAPGVWMQRRRPDSGTGLVLVARTPQ